MTDNGFAYMFAVSCCNAKLSGTQIAILADGICDQAKDPAAFKERVRAHYGLDMFDEFYWKTNLDFKEIQD